MEDWFPTSPGFFMYYPSRRQKTQAVAMVIDALRLGDAPG
jgi:hypothetical protein